jgi:hypothetical protein
MTDALLSAFRETFPDLPVTCVGRCAEGLAQVLVDGQAVTSGGFSHFG